MFAGEDFETVYNGISTEVFYPASDEEKERVRRKYGISPDKKIVLSVTPLFSDPNKGGAVFTELAERLGDGYEPVIVGKGTDAAGAVRHIEYVDDQRELAALYSLADVFVIPSLTDNYPTVCLEANCCGTPVVGFLTGGVPETIGEGLGEAVPCGDVCALTEAAVKWADKKRIIPSALFAERRRFNGRERMVDDYLKVYTDMMKTEGTGK